MTTIDEHKPYPFQNDPNHIYNYLKDFSVKYVDMGWRDFEICLAKDLKDENGTSLDGSTNFTEYKINLDISLIDQRAREIILHEVIHCILETCGLDEYSSGSLPGNNESLTIALTHGLLLFRRLNKTLAGFIC